MKPMRVNSSILIAALCVLVGSMSAARAADMAPAAGPTEASALVTDEALAAAIQNNDTDGIERILADDWAVVATFGGLGEGKSIFPQGIKTGHLTRKTYEMSEPRVKLYGDVAVVTTKIKTSGTLGGKPFDVMERQTDVLVWKGGTWKCVLTHETKITG